MRAFTRGLFRQAPSEADTADAMRALAEVFMRGAEGFAWDGADVARLDEVCDQYLIPGQRTMSTRQALSARMGAYVGELLVRNAGGRWVYDEACRSAAVELPSGHRVFPAERVAQRIAVGHHYSVAEFYRATLAGDLLSYPHRQAG
ncbi:DUF3806 domain-containing protein [Sporichthya sp.]|uniref:DUF3806 domain-containing protein n=1 Tax=Sporichthya sp. TaxID=65475 RepID=UPI0017F45B1B|nr:DUF3806 domain-containing protein [Sporichthya sp.]MBA3742708.1 DUF3806 domain-containing protein [Sporichthya sp.]